MVDQDDPSYELAGPPDGVHFKEDPDVRMVANVPVATGAATLEAVPGLVVDYEIKWLEQGAVVTMVKVTPQDAGGITSSALRGIRLGLLLRAVNYFAEVRHADLLALRYDPTGPQLPIGDDVIEAHAAARGVGQPPVSPDLLRRIAEARLRADARGSENPSREIAEEFNYGDRVGYVTSLIGKATKAGWLAPSSPGRRTRSAGPLLIASRHAESPDRGGAR